MLRELQANAYKEGWVWKSAQGIFKKPYERHPEPSLDGFG